MPEKELLKLCKFYGKCKSFPSEEEEERALTLSSVERNCVRMLLSYPFRPDESPRKVFDNYVEAQIGKWLPYEYNELMELYFGREEE